MTDIIQLEAYEQPIIRKSKLDNPLTHLFKKNKLVETLSGALTWVRDSGKTYVDRYGTVKYSPSTTATNLLLHSEDFSNAAWVKTNSSTTQSVVLSPDGKANAYEVFDNATSGTHLIQQTVSSVTGDTTLTLSAFVKRGTLPECVVSGTFNGFSPSRGVIFNFDTESLSNLNELGVIAPDSSSFQKLDGGWYRIQITQTVTNLTSTVLKIGTYNGSLSYVGDGVGSVYAWGTQLEESRVANAYIKTEATSETGTSQFGIDQSCEEAEGWLIEGSSTNLLTHSENFLDPSWVQVIYNGGSSDFWTVTQNTTDILDIYETNTAHKFVATATPGTLLCRKGGLSLTGTTSYTSSIYIYVPTQVGVTDYSIRTDLDNIDNNAEVFSVFDEWIRVELPVTTTAARSQFDLEVRPNSTTPTQGFTVYAMATQLEQLPFASSYIPTTTTAVTRAADDVDIQGYNNVPAIKTGTPLSVAVKFDTASVQHSIVRGVYSEKGTDAQYLKLRVNANSQNVVGYRSPGGHFLATNGDLSLASYATTVRSDNTLSAFYDGVLVNSSVRVPLTEGVIPTLKLGRDGDTTGYLYGHMQDFRIYDFELNADEVAYLSGE